MLDGQTQPVVEQTAGGLTEAVSLALAPNGDLFVVDAGTDQLIWFSGDLSEKKRIGGRGWGDYAFDQPEDVCASFALEVYVTDYMNRRIQRYDRVLNFVQSLTVDDISAKLGGSFYPRAACLSEQGELFVVESDGRRIVKFDPSGKVEREFGGVTAGGGALLDPRDIAIDPDGRLLVLDGTRVSFFDVFGNYTGTCLLPTSDSCLALSAFDGGFLVTGTRSVRLFDRNNALTASLLRQDVPDLAVGGQFRDAWKRGTALFLLTEHALFKLRYGG